MVDARSNKRRGSQVTGPTACVLGEIDLVRALGIAGVPCAVAAVPGDPATFSRHTVELVPWFDPWEEAEAMLRSLIAWAQRQTDKPVLFYNGDHDLLLVSRNRSALKDHFRFVIAAEDLVEDLTDKQRFTRLAGELDLPVPPTLTFDPDVTSPDSIDLHFPLLLKPLTRRDALWRPVAEGGKAIRIETPGELRALWPRLKGQGSLLAQTLIRGDESRIASYHVYVSSTGENCEFTGRKIRTLPREFGDTTALEITDDREVAELGCDLVERLGLTGVAKFDFKRDEQGKLWLLEVNARFNLWHHAGALAGANIPAAVYRDLTGTASELCRARPGVTWVHPTRDLRAARAAGMSTIAWTRWFARADARWAMSLKDPQPFARGVLGRRLASKMRRT